MPKDRQMLNDRQRKDSVLEAPDTGHYIYYPAVMYLWSDLRAPLLLPFEVASQGTSPSQKGKCTFCLKTPGWEEKRENQLNRISLYRSDYRVVVKVDVIDWIILINGS